MNEYIVKDRPTMLDNDRGQVLIMLDGRSIRAWSYQNDIQRRKKMMYAREYIEGWCDGRDYQRNVTYVLKGIHLRKKLRDVLIQFAGETVTKDKRTMIVNTFWPPEPEDQ